MSPCYFYWLTISQTVSQIPHFRTGNLEGSYRKKGPKIWEARQKRAFLKRMALVYILHPPSILYSMDIVLGRNRMHFLLHYASYSKTFEEFAIMLRVSL